MHRAAAHVEGYEIGLNVKSRDRLGCRRRGIAGDHGHAPAVVYMKYSSYVQDNALACLAAVRL